MSTTVNRRMRNHFILLTDVHVQETENPLLILFLKMSVAVYLQ